MVEGAEFGEVIIFLNQDFLVIRNIFPMQLLNVMYLSEQYIFSSRQKKILHTGDTESLDQCR